MKRVIKEFLRALLFYLIGVFIGLAIGLICKQYSLIIVAVGIVAFLIFVYNGEKYGKSKENQRCINWITYLFDCSNNYHTIWFVRVFHYYQFYRFY